jgi:lipopolysaccharide export system permease protein
MAVLAGAPHVRVLDRYLVRSVLVPLGGSLVVFLTLSIVVDLFEKLDTFIDHSVSVGLVTRYYVATVPSLVALILPITMLIGVLFSLGGMARRNELIAMTAAGVSLYRILRPVFACGLAVSVVGLAFTTELVPRGNRISHEIYDHEIKDRPRISGTVRRDLSYLGAGGRFFLIRRYDGEKGRMDDVVVQQFSEGTLTRRIDAVYALWDGQEWVFHDGFLRTFRGNAPPHVEQFEERSFEEIREKPHDFLRPVKEPDEMTLPELSDHILRTAASGGDVRRLQVNRDTRYSFPFASFIVVLLGAPLTGAIRRGGHALGFGIALLVGFLYYILLQVGETFGDSGSLPPVVAAWLPNATFVLAGAIGLYKTRK